MNGRSKHLLSNDALPQGVWERPSGQVEKRKFRLPTCVADTRCDRVPRARSHHMPSYRMPTCVQPAGPAEGKRKRRSTTRALAESGRATFRDNTLGWFKLGDALEDQTGAYELEPPEQVSSRTTRILVGVSSAAGLLIAVAWLLS